MGWLEFTNHPLMYEKEFVAVEGARLDFVAEGCLQKHAEFVRDPDQWCRDNKDSAYVLSTKDNQRF
jgi:hypothetical protein